MEHATTTPRPGSGQMFDRIAGRYDFLNRVLSLGLDRSWRRRAAEALVGGRGNEKFLDVACGTGDLSFEILRRHAGCSVVGVDPSAGMLEVMGQKATEVPSDRLRFELGAAEHLDFPDDSFDGVTISFGLRNVADRPAALKEMLRVVRPGRPIVVLEFTEPQGNKLGAVARFHIHKVVPRIGALLSGAPEYRYLEESIEAFPSAAELEDEMREAGAERVWVEPLTMGAVHLIVASQGLVGP